MPISVNGNSAAFEAAQNLRLTSQDFVQAVRRLSSGLRITSAADDPAGLAVSEKLVSRINGFDQAQRNIQDAVSLVQQGEAGLNETQSLLQRMNQLAIQASNGTLTSTDRLNIQQEVVGLISEIDRVAQQTSYNTKILLNGSAGGATLSGGGPDITDVQVQAGVTPSTTTVAITNGTAAGTASYLTGSQNPTAGTFVGAPGNGGVAPSITITGPTGLSATFTSYAGETIATFLQQVNNSGIGVTASGGAVGSSKVVLTSNDIGVKNGSNPSGAQTITVSGGNDADFGTAAGGAGLGLEGQTATAGTNTQLAVSVNGGAASTVTLTGINSDQYNGTGLASGVSFRLTDPGTINNPGVGVYVDKLTVTQNPPLNFQVGASSGQSFLFSIDAQTSTALGVNGIDLTTQASAEAAITPIQSAINQVSTAQANLGAVQNRLTDAGTAASAFESNLQAANANIMDANIAQETIRFTSDQILMQAGTAVLAQANQAPVGLLSLIGGTAPGH